MIKKGYLLLMIGVIFIMGCTVPLFNTEADLEYGEIGGKAEYIEYNDVELKKTENDIFYISIPIVNNNSVKAKVLKVRAEVNGESRYLKIIYGGKEWNVEGNTQTVIKVNPFKSSTNEKISFKEENQVKIKEVEIEDQNENKIKLGEISQDITINGVTNQEGSQEEAIPTKVVLTDITTDPTGTKITLSWVGSKEEENVIGYKIYKYVSNDGIYVKSELKFVESQNDVLKSLGVTTQEVHYIDENLTQGKVYFYVVTALNDILNESSYSDKKGQKLLSPVSYDVEELTASSIKGTTNIKLSWSAPINQGSTIKAKLAGYKIYRKTATTIYGEEPIASITDERAGEKEYLDKELDESQEYTYKIVAYDEIGTEGKVKEVKITAPDNTAPEQVTGLVATLLPGYDVEINWKKSEDANLKEYKLYTQVGTGEWSSQIVEGQIKKIIEFDETSLNEMVRIKITATDLDENESVESETVSIKLNYEGVIPAPEITKIIAGSKSVSLEWKVVEVDGYSLREYQIFENKTGVFLKEDLTTPSAIVKGNSYKKENMEPGEYYYKIKAKMQAGEIGVLSGTENTYVYDDTKSMDSKEIEVDPASDGVKIRWQDINDGNIPSGGYVLLKAIGEDKEENYTQIAYNEVKKTENGVTYTKSSENIGWYTYEDSTARTVDETYYYKVALYKESETKIGVPSPMKSATISPAPTKMGAPGVRGNLPHSNSISVSWTKGEDTFIAGYKVYISRTPDGKYSYIGTTGDTFMALEVVPAGRVKEFTTSGELIGISGDTITVTTGSSIKVPGWKKAPGTEEDASPEEIENDNGDRVYYYSNVETPDGEIHQRIQYIDLSDPYSISNIEGERRREFYIKTTAISKSGGESEKSIYSRLDLIAPKENNIGISTDYTKKVDDKGKATFSIKIASNDLGVKATKYELFKQSVTTTTSSPLTTDGDVNGDIEALEYEESEIKGDGLGNAYIDLDGNNIYLGKIGEYMKSYGGAWTRITLNN